jgi:hypothetical protein
VALYSRRPIIGKEAKLPSTAAACGILIYNYAISQRTVIANPTIKSIHFQFLNRCE